MQSWKRPMSSPPMLCWKLDRERATVCDALSASLLTLADKRCHSYGPRTREGEKGDRWYGYSRLQ